MPKLNNLFYQLVNTVYILSNKYEAAAKMQVKIRTATKITSLPINSKNRDNEVQKACKKSKNRGTCWQTVYVGTTV